MTQNRHHRVHLAPTLAVLALFLISPGQCYSAMYRWVDQDGITIYSQSPPPAGGATEIRKDPVPGAADTEAARERLQQQLAKEFDKHEAETEAAAKEAAEQESTRRGSEACAAARKNRETIENLGARRALTPEGDAVYLSDEQRKALKEKADDQIREFCK